MADDGVVVTLILGSLLGAGAAAASSKLLFFDSIMFDDDWPRVHLGIVVSCYLAQFIWIIGALKWRHLQASQSPLCVHHQSS